MCTDAHTHVRTHTHTHSHAQYQPQQQHTCRHIYYVHEQAHTHTHTKAYRLRCVLSVHSGYYPKGGGEVVTTSYPCKVLSATEITDRGNVTRIFGRAFVAGVLPMKVGNAAHHICSL